MSPERMAALLQPYLIDTKEHPSGWTALYDQLSAYLDLLLKWNQRTNLTAIREPEEIVQRHFGESLFAAAHIGPCVTLLDFGSGAGFPGVPIQLVRPDIRVTLGESQGKKASFLREVARELRLDLEVFADRIETMPPDRRFDTVTLRAVDNMTFAIEEAANRADRRILLLTSTGTTLPVASLVPFQAAASLNMPESQTSQLKMFDRA